MKMNSFKPQNLTKHLLVLLSASALVFFMEEKSNVNNQDILIQTTTKATQVSLSQEDQLEKEVNAFVLSFLVACDESVFLKHDQISNYFISTSNQNYKDALNDIMDPDIQSYLTTGGPVKNLTKKGNTLQFSTDFERKVGFSDKSTSIIYGEREWVLRAEGSSFKIESYTTKLLNQEPSTENSTSMDLKNIAKGDYSSVAGTWVNKQSTLFISPNGIVEQPNYLASPEPFTSDNHVKTSGIIRAALVNKSGVGKSHSIYFVPRGESIDPSIPGYQPRQDKERILILEYSSGNNNPMPTVFQEYTRP